MTDRWIICTANPSLLGGPLRKQKREGPGLECPHIAGHEVIADDRSRGRAGHLVGVLAAELAEELGENGCI